MSKLAKNKWKRTNFVACDTVKISKIREIINKTSNSKLIVGYKFGLEFLNSKNGRTFISKLKNKIIFADLKFDIQTLVYLLLKLKGFKYKLQLYILVQVWMQ